MRSRTRPDRGRAAVQPARGAVPLWPLALALVAAPAHALELGWLVGGGVEYSDNINLAADGEEESEWIQDVRAGLMLREETSRFEGEFDGLVQLENYADDTFSEGVIFEGTGSAEAQLLPGDRLTWMVADSFRRVPEVTRSVDTRGNEQNANAFVTGPDTELPLGSATLLRASARWGDFYFEDTEEDHTRDALQIGLARRVSAVTELSLNARTEDVSFDDEAVDPDAGVHREDFETNSAFARYQRELANRGRIRVDLGGYEVERDVLESVDGTMAQFRLSRGLGATAETGFRVSQGPTDIGSQLAAAGDDPLAADAENASITGDVGEEQTADAFYSHGFGRLSLRLSGGARSEDYFEDDDHDRTVAYGAVGLDYQMTRRRTVFADYSQSHTEYDTQLDLSDSERDYNEFDGYSTTLGFEQRIGRALTLTAAVGQNRRNAHAGGVDYTENRARVTLQYGFGHPEVVGDTELFDEDV